MKIPDATLKQIEESTRASLASAHPNTSMAADTTMSSNDDASNPVIDMARL